ncbi:MAG: hypothetical protein HYZ29_05730 [Myxococcales bacterium]|nr:hypothetical protein [Myxococcales bacterium]
MRRWLGAVMCVAAVSASGCGDSESCNGMACVGQGTLEAGVPSIGSDTWTVQACQNADCATATLTAKTPSKAENGLSIAYVQGDGGWRLSVRKNVVAPKDGDVWSLRVTAPGGVTIFEGERAVSYQTYGDSCQRCLGVQVSF